MSIWQDVKGKLAFKDKTDITITSEKNSYLIEVLQNISYKVKCLDKENDWISFSSDNDNLFNDIGVADKDFTSSKFSLHVNENLSQEKRNAKIVIYNGTYHYQIHYVSYRMVVSEVNIQMENIYSYKKPLKVM